MVTGEKLLKEYAQRGKWAAYNDAELTILTKYLRYDLATPWAVNTARWLRRIYYRRNPTESNKHNRR